MALKASPATSLFAKLAYTLAIAGALTVTGCGSRGAGPASNDISAPDLVSDEKNTYEGEEAPSEASIAEAAMENSQYQEPVYTMDETDQVLGAYANLDPKRIVPTALLKKAVLYFNANKSKLKNPRYLSVIDFGKHSKNARLYIVNMSSGSVQSLNVAHGAGSDKNNDGVAESFSNSSGSHASSIGYYRTAETYYGKNGLSLRLDGLSSTNSAARRRAVVIHGASYVKDARVKAGRSWGCPAVSQAKYKSVISILKGGSLIYAAR